MKILSSIARAGRVLLSHARVTAIMGMAESLMRGHMMRHTVDDVDAMAKAHRDLSLKLMQTYIDVGQVYLRHETGEEAPVVLTIPDFSSMTKEDVLEFKKDATKLVSQADKAIAALGKDD